MATTIDTLNDAQIVTLSNEAAAAGDLEMARICLIALLDERGGFVNGMWMPRDHARQMCASVIADAEAMMAACD